MPKRPEPPADAEPCQDHNQAACERHFRSELEFRLAPLATVALDGKEVDLDHRSPARLSASPTATAAVGTMASRCSAEYFAASSVTFLNGSNSSTGVPNRSCRASPNPSTRDAPPLSMMRSM